MCQEEHFCVKGGVRVGGWGGDSFGIHWSLQKRCHLPPPPLQRPHSLRNLLRWSIFHQDPSRKQYHSRLRNLIRGFKTRLLLSGRTSLRRGRGGHAECGVVGLWKGLLKPPPQCLHPSSHLSPNTISPQLAELITERRRWGEGPPETRLRLCRDDRISFPKVGAMRGACQAFCSH